jgi:surface antigen
VIRVRAIESRLSLVQRALIVLALLFASLTAVTVAASPARADTITYSNLNYPWANAAYVDANYDWGYSTCPSSDPGCMAFYGYNNGVKYGESDPWNYYFRNCTSYVAWKLTTLGVSNLKVQHLGNGGQWADNASKNGLTWSPVPKVGTAAVKQSTSATDAGHVAFVESVNADGTITVSEYNHDMKGDGDTRTGMPASLGFTKFVDFGLNLTSSGGGSNQSGTFDSFDWRHMTYIGTDHLNDGDALLNGQYMMSSNGQWALALQNGIVALYSGPGGPRWQVGTSVSDSALAMQNDGNLVLYGPNSSVLWSSATGGNSGDALAVQNDGNVVIYSWSGVPIWASNTGGGFPANDVGASGLSDGQSLAKCSALTSADRRFRLVLTCGGELLEYGPGYSVMWRTNTSASDSALAMQNDGNLVLYGANSSVLWSSATGGNSGDSLVVQTDGNMVIYSWSGVPIWASNT